jgi:diguanylate cyclase (GGDEF)-like protein/PAS domain S-box-containing protein
MNACALSLDLLTTWMVELDDSLRIRSIRQPAAGCAEMPFTNELPVGLPLVQAMGLCATDAADLAQRLRASEEVRSYRYSIDNELLGIRRYVISAAAIPGRRGRAKGYQCSISDLTATVALASRHDENEAQLAAILDAAPSFLIVKDLEGRYVRLNAAARKIIGHWSDAPIGRTSIEIMPPDLAADMTAEDDYVLETERGAEFEQHIIVGNEVKTYLTSKFPIFDADGCIIGVGATGMDITDRKRMVSELDRLANYDVLTDLPNRRLCQHRLNEALLLATHADSRIAVVLVDINDFRILNSTLGQDAGDEILVETAWRLQSLLPESATVARLSADEFCILLTPIDEGDQVTEMVDRVHRAFAEPITVHDREIYAGVTTGTAIYPMDADGFEQLLAKADMALQHAKRNGLPAGAFAEDMERSAAQRARIAHLLRRAVERRELQVVYQPIVESISGETVMLEALLRWHSAELGSVSPELFIPIAEDTGLIQAIGAWTMKVACDEAAAWNMGRPRPIGVSVNVSPRQLLGPGFATYVARTLKESGLPAHLLKIEITETCLAQDIDACRRILDDIAGMGVLLALDDFGTGYSALSYLQNFNFHILKLDKSFVQKIAPGESSAALTASIIAMARSLGMKTVAEGVERIEHVNILRFQGCDYLQGYCFSKPLPRDQLPCLQATPLAA